MFLYFRLLVSLYAISLSNSSNNENFYEFISSYFNFIENYTLPTNNKQLYGTCDSSFHYYEKYDFIIIGGGSAGSILASRLSEISEWNVLLLEAGGEQNVFSDVPNFDQYLRISEMNWGYNTIPQKTCCQGMVDNQSLYPREKSWWIWNHKWYDVCSSARFLITGQAWPSWTNLTSPDRTLEENLMRYMKAESPLTNGAGCEQIGFINTKTPGKGDPDVEFLSVPPMSGPIIDSKILYNFRDDYRKVFEGFSKTTDLNFLLLHLQPKSRGSVTLKSNSAIDFPLIDPRYFSDDGNVDIETTYQGIKIILSLTETSAFKNINATLISTYPGCEELKNEKSDREYWYCAIRHISTSIYHPIGTTKMGISPYTSVVNGDCLVHNMKRLRVVDAGVIPESVRGHTNAVTYMIAEKISHVIKKYYGK
ncbi:hypothetical protein JTB14_004578 [Gonioctena quinquepunctata]|nr:hypothetical protein JTB14_004578 [Gonioctena quinquepunctata]